MKLLFLLPPSEGKKEGGNYTNEKISFNFNKPLEIAIKATEKDLKSKGKRYEEGINLNKTVTKGPFELAIHRYSGVMYNAINYDGMSTEGQKFFQNNFAIISGMYGIVKPLDIIGNYKLPIETKGLYAYWGEQITDQINEMNIDYVVNLLSGSYWKAIKTSKLEAKIINVNFLKEKDGKIVKISHGVKKIKGEWIHNICEKGIINYKNFGEKITESENIIDVNIICD